MNNSAVLLVEKKWRRQEHRKKKGKTHLKILETLEKSLQTILQNPMGLDVIVL